MALYLFASAILQDRPFDLFNQGEMLRDFTYVDDVVESLVRLLDRPPDGEAPAQVFNVGNSNPVKLKTFLGLIEKKLGKKALVRLAPMQPGDVVATAADAEPLERYVGFRPNTALEAGIDRSLSWYLDYQQPQPTAPARQRSMRPAARRLISH